VSKAAISYASDELKPLGCADLISIADLKTDEVGYLLALTEQVKAHPERYATALAGRHVAMFFEKPSLRTRLTFEVGVAKMGGTSSFVDQNGKRLDARESLKDIAHNLERWVDAIVLRTFDHGTVTGMAKYAGVPVVNALTDLEHPCQALADYFTLQERFGDLRRVKLAWVGDGNNVAHSLMQTAAALGSSISVATPVGYEPEARIVAAAQATAAQTGGKIQITNDPVAAVSGADAVYTDVWASMGQESEAAQRKLTFAAYQVNEKLFAGAAPRAVFMHCLPARRGDEVTDAVMDDPRSVVFDQAENRMHVHKAILLSLLAGGPRRLAMTTPSNAKAASAGDPNRSANV
jgi:ornithine carbamoyltransferase